MRVTAASAAVGVCGVLAATASCGSCFSVGPIRASGLARVAARPTHKSRVVMMSEAAPADAAPAVAEEPVVDEKEMSASMPVETSADLPSDVGIDYVPLATMLACGDYKGADQFTRDTLIKAAGEGSQKRGFVYWTDVQRIPNVDMLTMEKLWLKYSKGKFGYSKQKEAWRRSKGDFETFCRRIGWNTQDGEVERKLRWFGASEFIYDVDKAPVGHLPLTSALRGTTLIKSLLSHAVWDSDEWAVMEQAEKKRAEAAAK